MEGCTDVYMLVNGPLTAIRYRDEILEPIVRPFAGAVGPGFPCPASCVQELSDALVQIREEIPKDTVHRLIRKMPRQCQACIQAHWGHANELIRF